MGRSPDEEAAIRRARHVLGGAQTHQCAEVTSLQESRDFLAQALLVVGLYASIALLVHHLLPNVITLVAVMCTLSTGVFTFCELTYAVIRLHQTRRRQTVAPTNLCRVGRSRQ